MKYTIPTLVFGAFVATAVSCGVPTAEQQQSVSSDEQPGIHLSVEELKEQFFRVSAGRRLRPESWPDGARVAVTFGFDIDNAAGNLARGDLSLEALSRGEYGAVDGLPGFCGFSTSTTFPHRSSCRRSATSCIHR